MQYLSCRRFVLAFLIAMFVSAAAFSQGGPIMGFSRQISGQVRYADSKAPALNVIVQLDSMTAGNVGQTQTDRNGKFSFSGLRAEQLRVVIRVPGYQTYEETVDLMTAPTGLVNVQLVRDRSSRAGDDEVGQRGSAAVIDANIPLDAQAEYTKAKALIDEGKPAKINEGIGHLEKAIAIAPSFFSAHLLLGLAHMDLKEWDKAEKALLDGLKQNPDSAEGHAMLAETYWAMAPTLPGENDFKTHLELSWKEVDKALKIKPSLPDAQLLAGNLLMKARRADAALPHFEEYLKLEPKGASANEVRDMVQKIKQALAQNGKS
jgi:Tfp pilus assembly protein PilF